MTDTTLNRFLASGTAAERGAFTPDPPTPASGPDPTYLWFETDTGDTYAWDFGGAAWEQVNTGSGAGDVVGPASATDNGFVKFDGTTGKLVKDSAATVAVGTEISGLGTGVATALGVNVGSAGAPVLFNGAGGTPSSLTLTNATGLPTAGLVDDAVTAAKLADTAVTPGSYTNTSLTVDQQGRITAASSGAAGSPYEASPTTIPDLSAFTTWRNQGTAAVTADSYGVYFTGDNDGEMHIREQNLPSTPFSYYARVSTIMPTTTANTTAIGILAGFALINTTSGRALSCCLDFNRISGDEQNRYIAAIHRWSSVTAINTAAYERHDVRPFHWLRVDVTSTDVTLFISYDGRRWVQAGSAESFASYVTATGGSVDKFGIFIRTSNMGASDLTHAYFDVLQSTQP